MIRLSLTKDAYVPTSTCQPQSHLMLPNIAGNAPSSPCRLFKLGFQENLDEVLCRVTGKSLLQYATHSSVSPFKNQVSILRPIISSLQTYTPLWLIKMFYNKVTVTFTCPSRSILPRGFCVAGASPGLTEAEQRQHIPSYPNISCSNGITARIALKPSFKAIKNSHFAVRLLIACHNILRGDYKKYISVQSERPPVRQRGE